jgi:hypothetical protein
MEIKMNKSITEIRNAKIVGNNSKSYNDKHPENPVSLRPIHDAIENTPKILDAKYRLVPDIKHIAYLRSLGNFPRMNIALMAKLR